MSDPGKKPCEISSFPDQPEIYPPEELPTKTWPEKNSEITPEHEPKPIKPPYEIPSPLED